LKNIFYDKNNRNNNENSSNNYSRDNVINDIKQENKELEKKIEIMVDRMKTCSEENKEYEAKVEKLKKDIKDLKANKGKSSDCFCDLTKIAVDTIEFKGIGGAKVFKFSL